MSPILTVMKHFALILLAALTWSVNAQITYPYNPDGNGDQYIAVYDLQDFLSAYGQEWIPGEIVVDSIPLSAYLEAMEALILANAMPAGTNPGQFLRWNGDGWELVMPKVGCTLPEACNYDETAHVLLESMCVLPDACGVCGGPGAVYDCGCADIPEGECDCDGNVVDALGVCGGTCEADEDGDGICDDGDSCVGQADECGVCNGPGAIYDCGCTEPVEGTCDCDGNVEDVLGVCGGSCTADEDFDGICDDEDDCVGAYDGCGVCNGPGPVLGCGCNDIPEGFCDCNGNVLDAVGTCGGACQNDLNGDGICDDGSIPGCTYEVACNYDPSASINDGSCDFTSCYGCTDIAACNYDPSATIDNGICWYAEASYDCDLNCLIDTDGDGVCDDLEVLGCTDEEACNFEAGATELDDSCQYLDECGECGGTGTLGCTDPVACNYDADAACDDGSCVDEALSDCIDPEACNFNPDAICSDGSCQYLDECGECGGTGTLGCTNPLASNYDEVAACDDGSCIVYGCTVYLACNYEPTANVDDNSCEFGTCPGCNDPNDFGYNPTSTNDSLCGTSAYFTNCGAEGRFGPTQLQCDAEYGPGVVVSNGGIQQWTVTQSGVYRIEALGAAGGTHVWAGVAGGQGAGMSGIFSLEEGQVLNVLVGQKGGNSIGVKDNEAPGGGGGSFLWVGDNELLIAAGGGGGGSRNNYSLGNANLEGYGNPAQSLNNAGENGNGGLSNCGSNWFAGGGAGWLSDGTGGCNTNNVYLAASESAEGGRSPSNGGYGGVRWNDGSDEGGDGGFGGGGGGGSDNMGTGGGGGYSGGGGGNSNVENGGGGGGGSYNSGSNQVNESGVNEGHGSVTITLISVQ